MTQPLEKLEARVYQLVQKFETLLGESRRHQLENVRLKAEQKRKDEQHQAAVDELSEALLVQVDKLKHDLQSKIDILTEENRHYRTLLEESAAEIRRLLARLPTKTPSETSPETENDTTNRTSFRIHHGTNLRHRNPDVRKSNTTPSRRHAEPKNRSHTKRRPHCRNR